MIKRILLGLGGTPYTSIAIRRAADLAKRFEAEVTSLTVIDVKGLSNGDHDDNRHPDDGVVVSIKTERQVFP